MVNIMEKLEDLVFPADGDRAKNIMDVTDKRRDAERDSNSSNNHEGQNPTVEPKIPKTKDHPPANRSQTQEAKNKGVKTTMNQTVPKMQR